MKDPSYFAFGLNGQGQLLWGDPKDFPVKSLPEYERLFEGADDAVAIGEASTRYLECPHSAARIHQQLPTARIICSLRHPIDRAYSDYQMYLRSQGRRLEPSRDLTATAAWVQPDSRWLEISRYHGQLKRYFDTFPREQIYILLSDDLRKNPLLAMQDLYRFLGVDPMFAPDLDTPHNVGGMPASTLLEGVFTSTALKSAVKPWIPKRAANWVRRLRTRNMRPAPPLPTELRQQLAAHLRDDIVQTSRLIGRSLAHWL